MFETVGTLPREYFRENPEEFDRVLKVMLKNETKLGYLSELNDDYWRAIIQSSQKPPVGAQKDALMEYKKDRLLMKLEEGNISAKFIHKRIETILKFSERLPELFLKGTPEENVNRHMV